jgi:hypothetical protein
MTKRILSSLGLIALFSAALSAQTSTLTSTTVSAAVASTDQQACLTSATGVTLPSTTAAGSLLYVDFEPMTVVGQGTSSTCFVVQRQSGAAHISGATVYLGAPNLFYSTDRPSGGACTASAEYVLPAVNIKNGHIFDCRSSGQWIQILDGTMRDAAVSSLRTFCTGTAGSAETEFLNEAACSGATTSTARFIVPVAGTLAGLKVTLSAAGAGGRTRTY